MKINRNYKFNYNYIFKFPKFIQNNKEGLKILLKMLCNIN